MSARDALFNDIWDMRSATEKNALIDAFAHELAEQIRQESSDQWDRGNQTWDTHDAADFIDPLKDAT
ncbi:hypothetical protein GCM10023084_03310 [Streptomyces lacrimifluminis]|uniref:hypothetical protein n=1 Tax=Streptomyces lacrimifluminis TaxID=1500077 RepID=UPI0031E8B400